MLATMSRLSLCTTTAKPLLRRLDFHHTHELGNGLPNTGVSLKIIFTLAVFRPSSNRDT